MARHPVTGKYRRARLFVLTLGSSRKRVRLLTFESSARRWAELHEEAFRRLGGPPASSSSYNPKEGVLTPDIYDPVLNPLYRDVLAHYGVVALPCRVGDPDRKGKVESAIGHTLRTPLKGLRFEHLEEGQAYLDLWDARWGDTRIHGTTKWQLAAMFAEERPHLLPLPLELFRYYQYGTRRVHLDGCVEVAGAYYAPPPGWLGRVVAVQWDEHHVRLLDPTTGTLLREHRRQARGRHAIHPADQPPQPPPTTLALLTRAAQARARREVRQGARDPNEVLDRSEEDRIYGEVLSGGRQRHVDCRRRPQGVTDVGGRRWSPLSRSRQRRDGRAVRSTNGITHRRRTSQCTGPGAPVARVPTRNAGVRPMKRRDARG